MKDITGSGLRGDYRLLGFAVVLLTVVGTSGCGLGGHATSETTGIVVGGTVGGATGDPLVGIAAGLVASWAMEVGLDRFRASQQAAVQDTIAQAAGNAEMEEASHWEYRELHGAVEVTRVFGKSITCKELVYTINQRQRFVYHVGTVCKSDDRWEWAVPRARARQWIEQPDPLPSGPHEYRHPFEEE